MKKSTQYGVSKSQEFGQFTPAAGRQAAELREQRIYFPSLLSCPRFHISLCYLVVLTFFFPLSSSSGRRSYSPGILQGVR